MGTCAIAFGDSSGKGRGRGSLRRPGERPDAHARAAAGAIPAELHEGAQRSADRRKVEGRYVTLLLVLWHRTRQRFTMANAGGSPPMICRDGEILKLRVEGVPLGLLPIANTTNGCFQAQPGDIMVLFSDGVSDHLSPGGEEYGRGRLAQVLRKCCECTTNEIVQEIFADLDRFNTRRFDDQTLIVMRVK